MDECLFCRIARGELPTTVVHESEAYLAFDDLEPVAEHHVLVIPRAHHENFDAFVAAGADAAGMLEFVSETAAKRGVAGRYRLITNVGREGGQGVFHLHWHILAGGALPGFH